MNAPKKSYNYYYLALNTLVSGVAYYSNITIQYKIARALELRRIVTLADMVAYRGSVRSDKYVLGFIGSWESFIPKIKVKILEIYEPFKYNFLMQNINMFPHSFHPSPTSSLSYSLGQSVTLEVRF